MRYAIEKIEGIGPSYAAKLAPVGIKTTADLLEHCATPEGRKAIAEKAGVSGTLLLRWVNMADLMRIDGIGEEFSELLEAAGVDTVRELQHRVPQNLIARMTEVNQARHLVRQLPTLASVEKWIGAAKTTEPAVKY